MNFKALVASFFGWKKHKVVATPKNFNQRYAKYLVTAKRMERERQALVKEFSQR